MKLELDSLLKQAGYTAYEDEDFIHVYHPNGEHTPFPASVTSKRHIEFECFRHAYLIEKAINEHRGARATKAWASFGGTDGEDDSTEMRAR